MAGGIGSRFWPMSRTNYPKQFLDILNIGRTLIQSTYDRFAKFIPKEKLAKEGYEQYWKHFCRGGNPLRISEPYVDTAKIDKNKEAIIDNIIASLSPTQPALVPCVEPQSTLACVLHIYKAAYVAAIELTNSPAVVPNL